MKANAMAFESPIPKIYDMLPPPKQDIEEILAILFTGPVRPTSEDFQRTPLLVRRNVVKEALRWLILNHKDYADVKFSDEHLMEYDEKMPPCSITWKQSDSNKTLESEGVNDNEDEDGTEQKCAFTVHGLTGEQLDGYTKEELTGIACQYFNNGGKVLAIGHKDRGESIW
ncbi:hypothetical protein MPER_07899 [Moniliophthora perniciosa FA553]|nr:hypothetical protein MPER_07899 [Moniliophthora perniciosa FA553]